MNKNNIILSNEEKKILINVSKIIENNIDNIFKDIQKDFFKLLCNSIYIKTFKDFYDFLYEELKNFLLFMKTGDINIPSSYGKLATVKGLDENIIFPIFHNIQNFIIDHININKDTIKIILKLSNEYVKYYLIAFHKEKSHLNNSRQEQLHRAVNNIIEVQRQKIITLHKRKMEIAQDEAIKRKKFIIELAHDIMSPLTLVRIQINKYIESGIKDDLLSLRTNIIKLIEMISSFFDYEKLEKSKMLYKHNDYINLSSYLLSKIKLSEEIFNERNITVYTEIQDYVFIRIHKHALDRIINNLIDNAVKYNNPGGTIEICLKKGDKVYLIIRDSGIGMSKEYIKTLFLPYYERPQNVAGGIGEGLSIIKNILKEISGSIDIYSKEGTGTSVILTFVNENGNIKKAIQKSESPIVLFHSKTLKIEEYEFDISKKTILLVDDDKEFLALLHETLSKEFNVFYAYNGQEAFEKIIHSLIPLPEIIISDIMMDKIDGHELYEKIYAIENLQDIPFIFITAKRDEKDKLNSYRQGVIDYVQKPFLIDELILKIKALLYTISVKNQKKYAMMMQNQKDQIMRDRSSDTFICYHLTCKKYALNRREIEITRYYLRGLLIKEIASKLFLSYHTIRRHIQQVYKKCKVNNRAELITVFTFYENQIKKALNTDYKSKELLENALKKDWRKEKSIFEQIGQID